MSADSTTDAWAVGHFVNASTGATQTLTLRWDGASWRRVPSPNPGGTNTGQSNQLTGVAALSPSDAWAVGDYAGGLSDFPHGLILHWDGTAWKKVLNPCSNADCFLEGVSADAPTDIWAVGKTSVRHNSQSLVLHWNGTSWSRTPSPGRGFLQGVHATSPTDVRAVGYGEEPSTEALFSVAMRWNGTSWTKVPTPNPAGKDFNAENLLSGVSGSSSNAWAVGSFRVVGGGVTKTLALLWTGTRWMRVHTPSPGGASGGSVSELNGVTALTQSDAWAVGDPSNGSKGWVRTLILHWDGSHWAKIASPDPSGRMFPGVNRLLGVSAHAAGDAWRQIPSAPIEPRYGGVYVWTGTEAIVWGGGREGNRANTGGAAYEPQTDAWRVIANAPIGLNLARGVWTGKQMIVFGSLINGRNIATTPHAVGAAYQPGTDTWRHIAPSELSPQSSAAVWTGDRMIAWDYLVHAAEYLPATNTWRHIPRVPVRAAECYVEGASIRGAVFAWNCGDAATLDPGTDQWHPVTGGVTAPTVKANGATYKLFRFASLAPAGDVLALAATGITVSNKGVPCYGCPGAPVSFWAWASASAFPANRSLRTPAGCDRPMEPEVPRVRRIDVLGGLIHEYELVAA